MPSFPQITSGASSSLASSPCSTSGTSSHQLIPIPAAHTIHRSVLLGHGRRSTFAAGGAVRSGYIRTAAAFSFLLMLYPICWACSEGANVISPTGEMIWYGILDLIAGPVFLFTFLFHLRSVDMAAFGLWSGKNTDTGYGHGGNGTVGPGMTTATGANSVVGTGNGIGHHTGMGAGRMGADGTTTGAGMGHATGNGNTTGAGMGHTTGNGVNVAHGANVV